MTTDQRREPRVPFDADAIVKFRGERRRARAVDLSSGGIRIVAPAHYGCAGEGEEVVVRLKFSFSSESISIRSRIVYELCVEDGQRHWGIRFRDVSKDARTMLALYLNRPVAARRSSTPVHAPRATPPPRSKAAGPIRKARPRKRSSLGQLIDGIREYLNEEEDFKKPRRKS